MGRGCERAGGRGCERTGERGQSLAEFAIVVPALLLLAFGIFDFGRGMSANITVTNASREGARYLAVHASAGSSATTYMSCYGTGAPPSAPASASAQGAAWRQAQNASLDMTAVTMTVRFYKAANDPAGGGAADDTVTCAGGSVSDSAGGAYTPTAGDWVQFEAVYTYATTTPLIHQLVNTVTLDRTTTMVLE